MSIWTSEQGRVRALAVRTLLGLGMMALAGCLAVPAGKSQALSKVAFYDAEVVVTGPRGYCVDGASLRRGASGSFALIASCESLTGTAGVYVEPAILTVSVLPRTGPVQQPDAQTMARALAPAEVRRAEDRDGISLVQVMQGGQEVLPGGDPVHWRAGMVINGHLVGLAIYGPAGSVVTGPAGREMLRDLGEALRGASPEQASAPKAAS
ncbi:hypothetical protein [Roseovarius sp. 217]|uniref:hypothetical protein n=1 Tax=Roseovarius sp. (strain 217) TaxID=314264 RepID=UPI000068653E|nr:hypothetical protein [Roseovarius sp. 217]EAQ24029.1 hypothetical protein ROS217_15880 [Roseovarius sp. 217]